MQNFFPKKGYEVHGTKEDLAHSIQEELIIFMKILTILKRSLYLHYGDLTDSTNLIKIIGKIKPNEIYNLGAQSHVAVSFESPE